MCDAFILASASMLKPKKIKFRQNSCILSIFIFFLFLFLLTLWRLHGFIATNMSSSAGFDLSFCSRHLVSSALADFPSAPDALRSFFPWAIRELPGWHFRVESVLDKSDAISPHCSQLRLTSRRANCQRRIGRSLLPTRLAWRESLWFFRTRESTSGWLCHRAQPGEAFLSKCFLFLCQLTRNK